MNFIKKIHQSICDHDWTCLAEEGFPPLHEETVDIKGFDRYATMYCKKCGKISDLSLKRIYNDTNNT